MNEAEEVKQRLDVAEVVGGYVQLKQAGRNLKAPCPFHNEKTASFMVSPEKGIWHCFGCGEGGDIFKFVMKMEGLEFRDALELLARRAGVELTTRQNPGAGREKKRLAEAVAWAVKYFQASLIKNPKALNYVSKTRGLARETIKDFAIGYAPETWEGLTKLLLAKGFTQDELIKAGLAGRKAGRTTVYDLFRGRIMFPIADAQGDPAGFTGRVLDDSQPKYLNTPQTPLYDKSRIIYGLHLAKESIRQSNEVVLVEGNMDVVASHKAGVRQVVAVSGTALTLDQLKTLSRLTKNVKLAFDQDNAGLAATERAIELAQKLGLVLSVVVITGAKDADELIKKDPEAWQKAISDAPYVFDYLFDRFEREYDLATALGKKQYSERLARFLRHLADVEQDHYVRQLATKLDVSYESVKAKVNGVPEDVPTHASRVTNVARPEPVVVKPGKLNARQQLEESILGLAAAYPETRLSLADLAPEAFEAEREAVFLELRDSSKTLTDLSDYAKILALRSEEAFGSMPAADRSFEAFSLTKRLQTLIQKERKQDLSTRLRQAEEAGDAGLVRSLLKEYQTLLKQEEL